MAAATLTAACVSQMTSRRLPGLGHGSGAIIGMLDLWSLKCSPTFTFISERPSVSSSVQWAYNLLTTHTAWRKNGVHENILFLFFFWLCCTACGMLVPKNLCPLHRVLTTGPPGKSS